MSCKHLGWNDSEMMSEVIQIIKIYNYGFLQRMLTQGKTKKKRFLRKLQNINISSWYCCCWNHLLEFGWLPRETYRLSVHLSFMLSSLTNACKHQRWVLQFTLKIYFMKDIETNCNKKEYGSSIMSRDKYSCTKLFPYNFGIYRLKWQNILPW